MIVFTTRASRDAKTSLLKTQQQSTLKLPSALLAISFYRKQGIELPVFVDLGEALGIRDRDIGDSVELGGIISDQLLVYYFYLNKVVQVALLDLGVNISLTRWSVLCGPLYHLGIV